MIHRRLNLDNIDNIVCLKTANMLMSSGSVTLT